ncbi:MAG TPA: hypothetical protein VHO47_03350 [Candidatus Babeliales bacterium]|nr:hypothetical protein [Candidatus Babeliales bacterium]
MHLDAVPVEIAIVIDLDVEDAKKVKKNHLPAGAGRGRNECEVSNTINFHVIIDSTNCAMRQDFIC